MILKPTAYLTGMTLLISGGLTLREWTRRSIYHHHTAVDLKLLLLLLIPFWLIGFVYILLAHFKYGTQYKPAPWLKLTNREFWKMYWGLAAVRFAIYIFMLLIAFLILTIKFRSAG